MRPDFIDQDREIVLFRAFFVNIEGALGIQPLYLPCIEPVHHMKSRRFGGDTPPGMMPVGLTKWRGA